MDMTITIAGTLAILWAYAMLMRMLWRRMKRVRASAPRPDRVSRDELHPVDHLQSDGEHAAGHGGYRVNDALIEQGAAARESRWPIN